MKWDTEITIIKKKVKKSVQTDTDEKLIGRTETNGERTAKEVQ